MFASWCVVARWMALCSVMGGCVKLLDEEHPTALEQAEDPGKEEPRAVLKSSCDYLGIGDIVDAMSLSFSEGAQWLFFHYPSVDEPGALVTSMAIAMPDAVDPCAGLEPVLDSGNPAAAIALDAEEAAFNEVNAGEQLLALWPLSGVVVEGRGIVFYQKLLFTNDDFVPVILGVGVAELSFGGAATRLVPGHYPDEPSLTWIYPQGFFGTGATMHHDGLLYVYGCTRELCRVARVTPDRVADPAAYEYYAGSEGWRPRLEQAMELVNKAEYLSASFNPALGEYLAVTRGLGPTIKATAAENPWGMYSEFRLLFVDDSDDPAMGYARQHPAYQSADGRSLLVSSQRSREGTRVLRLHRLELE